MIYFLRLHLLAHESESGRVKIRTGLILPFPVPDESEEQSNLDLYIGLKRLYDEFMAENPEAAPNE